MLWSSASLSSALRRLEVSTYASEDHKADVTSDGVVNLGGGGSVLWVSANISHIFSVFQFYCSVFTALHEMQTRSSDENFVCPSVCPSVWHTRDPWQNGRKIGPEFYTIRKNNYPRFLRRRMVGGGRTLLREILGQPTPIETKSPIFNQ